MRTCNFVLNDKLATSFVIILSLHTENLTQANQFKTLFALESLWLFLLELETEELF